MVHTKIMGILNVTPDSFYPESRCFPTEENLAFAVTCAKYLEAHGADYIDIGGESTRPGATPVSLEEEIRRVIPTIQALKSQVDIPLSIDTMKAQVALAAVQAGAELINDVSGFSSPEMRKVAASYDIPICAVHMKPQPMMSNTRTLYPNGVINDLLKWSEEIADLLIKDGVKEKNIILDPGIGFGKTVADNFEILHNLSRLKKLGFPLLLGISRKSFMGKVLNLPPSELLAVTLAVNSLAIEAEIDYIRVHDVKEHREAITVLNELISTEKISYN